MVSVKQLNESTNEYKDKTVTVAGWVRTIRESKNFGFIELHDGTFFKTVQIVFEEGVTKNLDVVKNISTGASITVSGKVVLTPDARQPFEIKANELFLEGTCPGDYPLQKKRHSLEFLRTIAHLRPRTNMFYAVFRVRSLVAYAIHEFFNQRDFIYVHTPIITGSDCEGAGEMFRVTTLDMNNPPRTKDGGIDFSEDFFGHETNLTVSGQLSGETFCTAFRNIYTFGPTFRAENSYTARHAAEFWMIEPEIAFAELEDDMRLAEDMVKHIINYILKHAPEEMEFFNEFIDKGLLERLQNVVSSDFGRITYTEAIDLLIKSGQQFEYAPKWGCDLQTEHERYLTEKVFGKPIFVINYPKEIKSFYMRVNEDGKTVAAMDLLVPGIGEIIGGSQREEREEILSARIEQLGMDMRSYWWYLDLRKYGSVKHCGFGLGFERIIMYITGMQNIRDVIPYPRTTRSAEF
ncbi:MAG: asparagine--tRNA ligase [Christensenellales bacterium]